MRERKEYEKSSTTRGCILKIVHITPNAAYTYEYEFIVVHPFWPCAMLPHGVLLHLTMINLYVDFSLCSLVLLRLFGSLSPLFISSLSLLGALLHFWSLLFPHINIFLVYYIVCVRALCVHCHFHNVSHDIATHPDKFQLLF